MIDIVLAMESVVDAIGHEMQPAQPQPHHCRQRSLVEAALALALPSARQPGAAQAKAAELLRDPLVTAEAWDCTFGAVLVWRAVARTEQDGASRLAAAEAGLTTALSYIDLMPEQILGGRRREELLRCGTLLLLELASRPIVLQPDALHEAAGRESAARDVVDAIAFGAGD